MKKILIFLLAIGISFQGFSLPLKSENLTYNELSKEIQKYRNFQLNRHILSLYEKNLPHLSQTEGYSIKQEYLHFLDDSGLIWQNLEKALDFARNMVLAHPFEKDNDLWFEILKKTGKFQEQKTYLYRAEKTSDNKKLLGNLHLFEKKKTAGIKLLVDSIQTLPKADYEESLLKISKLVKEIYHWRESYLISYYLYENSESKEIQAKALKEMIISLYKGNFLLQVDSIQGMGNAFHFSGIPSLSQAFYSVFTDKFTLENIKYVVSNIETSWNSIETADFLTSTFMEKFPNKKEFVAILLEKAKTKSKLKLYEQAYQTLDLAAQNSDKPIPINILAAKELRNIFPEKALKYLDNLLIQCNDTSEKLPLFKEILTSLRAVYKYSYKRSDSEFKQVSTLIEREWKNQSDNIEFIETCIRHLRYSFTQAQPLLLKLLNHQHKLNPQYSTLQEILSHYSKNIPMKKKILRDNITLNRQTKWDYLTVLSSENNQDSFELEIKNSKNASIPEKETLFFLYIFQSRFDIALKYGETLLTENVSQEFRIAMSNLYRSRKIYTHAINVISPLIHLTSEDDLLVHYGELLFQSGQIEKARLEWEKIIIQNPDNPESYQKLSSLYYDYDMTDNAISTIRLARARFDSQTLFSSEMGGLLEIKDDLENASIENAKSFIYRSYYDWENESSLKFFQKLFKKEKNQIIDTAFETVLSQFPDSTNLLKAYSALLEDKKEELKFIDLISRISPKNSTFSFFKNSALPLMENSNVSDKDVRLLTLIEKLQRISLNDPVLNKKYFELCDKNHLPEKSREHLEKIEKLIQENIIQFPLEKTIFENELIDCYIFANQFQSALPILEQRGILNSAQTLLKTIQLFHKHQKYDSILPLTEKGFEKFYNTPQLDSILQAHFSALENLEKYPEIHDFCKESIRILRNKKDVEKSYSHPAIRNLLKEDIRIYQKHGKPEEVISAYERFLNSDPEDMETLQQAYRFSDSHSQSEKLLSYYEKVAETGGKNYRWDLMCAQMNLWKGNVEKAIEHYKKAFLTDPQLLYLGEKITDLFFQCSMEKQFDESVSELLDRFEKQKYLNYDEQYRFSQIQRKKAEMEAFRGNSANYLAILLEIEKQSLKSDPYYAFSRIASSLEKKRFFDLAILYYDKKLQSALNETSNYSREYRISEASIDLGKCYFSAHQAKKAFQVFFRAYEKCTYSYNKSQIASLMLKTLSLLSQTEFKDAFNQIQAIIGNQRDFQFFSKTCNSLSEFYGIEKTVLWMKKSPFYKDSQLKISTLKLIREIYENKGFQKQAGETIDLLISLKPFDANLYLDKCRFLMGSGQTTEIQESENLFLELSPFSSAPYIRLFEIAIQKKSYFLAEKYFNKLEDFKLSPQSLYEKELTLYCALKSDEEILLKFLKTLEYFRSQKLTDIDYAMENMIELLTEFKKYQLALNLIDKIQQNSKLSRYLLSLRENLVILLLEDKKPLPATSYFSEMLANILKKKEKLSSTDESEIKKILEYYTKIIQDSPNLKEIVIPNAKQIKNHPDFSEFPLLKKDFGLFLYHSGLSNEAYALLKPGLYGEESYQIMAALTDLQIQGQSKNDQEAILTKYLSTYFDHPNALKYVREIACKNGFLGLYIGAIGKLIKLNPELFEEYNIILAELALQANLMENADNILKRLKDQTFDPLILEKIQKLKIRIKTIKNNSNKENLHE